MKIYRKLASIIIPGIDRRAGLTSVEIKKFMDENLPLDARIVGFICGIETSLLVASKEFPEMKEYELIPSVEDVWKKDTRVPQMSLLKKTDILSPGTYYFEFRKDYIKVWEKGTEPDNFLETNWVTCDTYGFYQGTNWNDITFYPIQAPLGTIFSNPTFKVLTEPICFHIWKHYQGLQEEYDYCEKCGERK